MKAKEFICPKCKHTFKVGKKLKASFTCPNCHNSVVITESEKSQGKKDYMNNFMYWGRDENYLTQAQVKKYKQ